MSAVRNRTVTVRLQSEQVLDLETLASFDGVAVAEEIREAIQLLLESRKGDQAFHKRVLDRLERTRNLLNSHKGNSEFIDALRL